MSLETSDAISLYILRYEISIKYFRPRFNSKNRVDNTYISYSFLYKLGLKMFQVVYVY